MQTAQSSLFSRDDTFLGVCEALGEDFGFNPLWLRVALAVPLIWAPAAVLGAYGALAVLVLISRLLFPKPRHQVTADVEPIVEHELHAIAEDEPLPLAA